MNHIKFKKYSRKSTESDERQILSIDAQLDDLERLADQRQLAVVDPPITEARSAKAPGRRPGFQELVALIRKRQVQGILVWSPDRLSRNAVDAGQIIQLLDEGLLVEIVTHQQTYRNTPSDKFVLALLLATAKFDNDQKSVAVRRGQDKKASLGWRPGPAPIGYRNVTQPNGFKIIEPDPERFTLMRQVWDLALRGVKVDDIVDIAREQLHLRVPVRKSWGGMPISRSRMYVLLADPFYAGIVRHRGQVFPGAHVPMVTQDEFREVQHLLGRYDRSRVSHEFPLSNLIRCGECGGAVVGGVHRNHQGRPYTYYYCGRPKHQKVYCSASHLEEQVCDFLRQLTVPDDFARWMVGRLAEDRAKAEAALQAVRGTTQEELRKIDQRADTARRGFLNGLLSDDEFAAERKRVDVERERVRGQLASLEVGRPPLEPVERAISFLNQAEKRYREGTVAQKRLIVKTVSSNLMLVGKKLLYEAKKPFALMANGSASLVSMGRLDEITTSILEESVEIPTFDPSPASVLAP